jgi:hypothetical protein
MPRPRTARARRPAARPAKTAPAAGPLSALLSILGAAVYFTSVVFAVGDGGVATGADEQAGRVALGIAGALCMGALVLAIAGLARGRQRAAALVGLVLGAGFLGAVGFTLW